MGGLIGLGGLGGNVGGIAGGAGGAGGGCARYEIVSARGTGEIQTNPTGSAGFLRGVLSAVPGGSKYEVVYPADVNYAVSPGRGAKNIDEHIRPKLASCPNEVFVFFGYSEGAMVVTQYMKNFKFPTDKLAAIVLYGNPHHTSGATQNVCTGKTGVGIASPLRIVMPAAPASVTFDCCNQGDMICQTGGTMGPHLTYPNSRNEKDAIAYTVGKLKAKLSKEGGNDADNDKGKAKGEGNGGNKGGGDGSNNDSDNGVIPGAGAGGRGLRGGGGGSPFGNIGQGGGLGGGGGGRLGLGKLGKGGLGLMGKGLKKRGDFM